MLRVQRAEGGHLRSSHTHHPLPVGGGGVPGNPMELLSPGNSDGLFHMSFLSVTESAFMFDDDLIFQMQPLFSETLQELTKLFRAFNSALCPF